MKEDLVSKASRECGWDTTDEDAVRRWVRRGTFLAVLLFLEAWRVCWRLGGWWAWGGGPILLHYGAICLMVAIHYLKKPSEGIYIVPDKAAINRAADISVGIWLALYGAPWQALGTLPCFMFLRLINCRRRYRKHIGADLGFESPISGALIAFLCELVGYAVGTIAQRHLS